MVVGTERSNLFVLRHDNRTLKLWIGKIGRNSFRTTRGRRGETSNEVTRFPIIRLVVWWIRRRPAGLESIP